MVEEIKPPDLDALRASDPDAWEDAFRYFGGVATRAARSVLAPYLPEDVDDIAITAVEALVEKVEAAGSCDELKRLVAGIARNKAVGRLREHFAARRGGGRTESLERRQEACGDIPELLAADSPLAALEAKELAERLRCVLEGLEPPQGEMLADSFLNGLSQKQIAGKYSVGTKSVGIRLARALRALRAGWSGNNDNL